MKRTTLVTGATGAIGPRLVATLCERGDTVRVLARRPPPPGLLPPGVAVTAGALDDPAAVRRALVGVDTVFHLAAMLHVNNPDPELRTAYQRVNVAGTRLLAEAARTAGVRRFVFFSTINVYGPSNGGLPLTEASPLHPDSYYAATKAEAEQVVLATLPATILRLAASYGPGMKGNYPKMVQALARGRFLPVGAGHNRRTLIHVADLCAGAVLAAEHQRAQGQIYNLTDGEVHTLRDIVDAICQALGRRPPRFTLPVTPLLVTAGALEYGFRLAGRRAPVDRATVRKLLEDVAVSGEKMARELGYRPRYDLLNGWRQTVQESGTATTLPVPAGQQE